MKKVDNMLLNKSEDELQAKVKSLHEKIDKLTEEHKKNYQKWDHTAKEYMETSTLSYAKLKDKKYAVSAKEEVLKLDAHSKKYAAFLESKLLYIDLCYKHRKESNEQAFKSLKEQVALTEQHANAIYAVKF